MKKTIQILGDAHYESPACEVISLASETAILTGSTQSFTIQGWGEEDLDDELTF